MVLRRNQVNVLMADSSVVTPEVVDALSNVQNYFYQTPNSKILIFPFKMRLYCATNPNDSSRWSNFWRTQGEPPVIYDPGAALMMRRPFFGIVTFAADVRGVA